MKKKFLFLMTIVASLIFSACDYNEKYFGLSETGESAGTTSYQYTITDADISTIVKAMYANKNANDSAMAKILDKDKVFSINAPASVCVPYLLKTKYIGANKGTSANITYKNKLGTSSYYTLTAADYFDVWGNNTVNALTPSKGAATVIPAQLKKRFPAAIEGDIRVVEYQFSTVEPTSSTVTVEVYKEDFEAYEAGSGKPIPTVDMFVVNKDLIGTFIWQCRTYNSNKYAQGSANGSTTDNEIWLVTKKINLSDATDNASFSFDVTAGFYNADCLTILVSENYDGTEAGLKTATWTDVTSNFTLPKEPASGYGTLATAGTMDFKAFAGKNVSIAFKYTGSGISDPKKTTTYQLDNIKVTYDKTAASVPVPVTTFGSYIYHNGVWVAETKSFYQLTAQDYTDMGVNTLSLTTAPNYLPTLLKTKFPYAQNDTRKTVIFKTSATANNSIEYKFADGVWMPVSMIENKTEQFVFSGWDVAGWVFDPTLYVTMKKGKEPTDDYMMVVNYVKEHFSAQYPTVVNTYGDTEYYYGFAAFYGNISLRETDRQKDPTYAALTTDEEKNKYKEDRTNEGLAVYLTLKFPDAQPQVSGIDVYAIVTTAIYDGVTTTNYVYKFQRVDAEQKWKFIEKNKQ